MNYEANTVKWKPGDLVLHDADAKRTEMLMRVIDYTKDGRCITQYAEANQMNGDGHRRKPERWENPAAHLHDPAQFGVSAPRPSAPEPEGDHTKCQMGAKSCSSCCISEMCEPEAPDAGKAVCPCQNDHQGETRRILAESNTDAACLSFAPQADDVGTE